jgi:predicted solute-binding protein
VFAAWALRPGVTVAPLLLEAKANGLAHLEEIVQDSTEATPEFRREYLTRNVWFDLGDAEKQGLQRFQRYLLEQGLIGKANDLRYVG